MVSVVYTTADSQHCSVDRGVFSLTDTAGMAKTSNGDVALVAKPPPCQGSVFHTCGLEWSILVAARFCRWELHPNQHLAITVLCKATPSASYCPCGFHIQAFTGRSTLQSFAPV